MNVSIYQGTKKEKIAIAASIVTIILSGVVYMNAQTIEHYLENPEHEENEDEGPKIEMHFPETVASGTYETLRVTKDEQELADARVYVDGIHHGETDMRGQRVIQTPEDGRFLLEVEFENETIQEVIKVAE